MKTDYIMTALKRPSDEQLAEIKQALVDKGVADENTSNDKLSEVIKSLKLGGVKALFDTKKSCYYEFYNSLMTTEELFNVLKYDDTSEVTNMYAMFENCKNVTSIPAINTIKAYTISRMFFGCSNVITLDNFNFSKASPSDYLFTSCSNLISVGEIDIAVSNSTQSMFQGCSKLTTVKSINATNIRNTKAMFSGCTNLVTPPHFETKLVTDMSNMFYGCTNLESVPAYNMDKVTTTTNMFYNCTNLKQILVTNIRMSLDISYSTKFERNDLVTLINNLVQRSSGGATRTITMGSTNLDKLTDEDKAIATNKGWTLA